MTPAIHSFLGFIATAEQESALTAIERFLESDHDFIIVRGAAGTGKTSIMSAVTKYVTSLSLPPVLLAPTGRAAKNLAQKTGLPAKTFHSCLYVPTTDINEAIVRWVRKENDCPKQQVFIADESSMVSDRLEKNSDFISQNSLLADFVHFVRQGNSSNKIIFIGDICQLPPVGYSTNEAPPALVEHYLTNKFGLQGSTIELSQIMGQGARSQILTAATELRRSMTLQSLNTPKALGTPFYNPQQAVDLYLKRYITGKHDSVAILSFGHNYKNDCNTQIRSSLGLTGYLSANDTVMVTQPHLGGTYIANGEMGVVKDVDSKRHRIADLEFVEAAITFLDENDSEFTQKAMVLLTSLHSTITLEQRKALFASEFRSNRLFRQSQNIRDSVYLNALQLNYGHAFTVHKAQGSEWDTVIMNTWMPKTDLRFLYTGITRARSELFTNGAYRYVS